jgi:TolB protein
VHKTLLNLVAALAALAVAVPASAQVMVRKSAGSKIGVDLSGLQVSGAAAQTVRRTLELDLNRSGWMEVAPAGQGAFAVRGAIADAGGQVTFRCQVTDAAGQTYVNAAYAQPAGQAVRLAHQVANDVVVKTTGKPTFFLGELVLVGAKGGNKELYLADSSCQVIQQLTNDRTVLKPRWSPDNRFIAYTSYLKRWPDVFTIERATGTRQQASFFPGLNSGGAISPNGRSMALILSKDGVSPDLYVQDMATKRLTRLTNTPQATEGSPCWSPDGSRIVFVSNASGSPQLYLVSSSGGAPQRLTARGAQNVAPDWGKNGLIAYQTYTGGKFQIAVMDPATMQERVITPFDASYEDPSWAPDGRHLAAARSVNYSYSVYLLDSMAALGDKPVALTSTGEWTSPAWSR